MRSGNDGEEEEGESIFLEFGLKWTIEKLYLICAASDFLFPFHLIEETLPDSRARFRRSMGNAGGESRRQWCGDSDM